MDDFTKRLTLGVEEMHFPVTQRNNDLVAAVPGVGDRKVRKLFHLDLVYLFALQLVEPDSGIPADGRKYVIILRVEL